jgi:homoserine dehydrogenase
MKPVKIGILGLGTVGCGTISVLARNGQEIARRAGREISIIQASARDLKKKRPCSTDGIKLVQDPHEVVRNPEIEVVVELIGGYEPARALVLEAIANGKHVVREGLAGNRIEWLAGIINGTSNFILTEMRDKGADFADALKEAQRLGYAEADPTFDVEGIDTAHKLTILAAIAFGIPLKFKQVYTEGITRITRMDVQYAEKLGYRLKLLGIARRTNGGVELRVHPTLIPERRLIANVDGAMNAVLVKGDAVGPTMFYGAGAGAEPTASAVVADLVDVVRTLTVDPNNRVPHLAFQPDALVDLPILPIEDVETSYYLRLHALDKPGVLAEVTRILADLNISIESILQKEPHPNEETVPVIILTQRVREKNMNEAIARIEKLASIKGKVARIRLEHLNADWK